MFNSIICIYITLINQVRDEPSEQQRLTQKKKYEHANQLSGSELASEKNKL
jgi:hypothetical protein